MDTFEIKASPRQERGPKYARQMRREGEVPGVVYGNGDNVTITLQERDLLKLLVSPNVYLVKLELEGKVEDVVVKEVQYHPVSDRPVHVDFYRYVADKPITLSVPVQIEGHAVGVRAGGKLVQFTRRLRVKGLASAMPNRLTVDVTELGVDKKIVAADLAYEGLTILEPSHTVVVMVRSQRNMVATVDAAAAPEKK